MARCPAGRYTEGQKPGRPLVPGLSASQGRGALADEEAHVTDLMRPGTALLVIDLQECGRMSADEAGIGLMPGFEDVVRRTGTAVAAFRAAGLPVLFSQEVHRPDLLDIGRELDGVEGVHCVDGRPGTELVAELRPQSDEHLVRKRRYSCFVGTDLAIVLRGMRVDTLVLAGSLTDVCVHYTFADAHQLDLHVRVLADCVIGSSQDAHDAALRAMAYLQRDALLTSSDLPALATA
ncbi:MAG: nicotinamidase-like amidase [Frankiales bacterium]|nr:nicotinamidase-like amidase [Frankiales bacterium]